MSMQYWDQWDREDLADWQGANVCLVKDDDEEFEDEEAVIEELDDVYSPSMNSLGLSDSDFF